MWPRKKCQLDISLFLANFIDLCVRMRLRKIIKNLPMLFIYGYPPILPIKINNPPIAMLFPSPLLIYFQKIIIFIKACFIYLTKLLVKIVKDCYN